jgi:hypothetical protein
MIMPRPLPALVRLLGPVIGLALTASCATDRGDYPALMPTAAILAEPALPSHAETARDPASAASNEATTSARAEALRRRASGLRAPVIEPDARARLQHAAP